MQLSVIIVNYNVKCFLEQCLYTVLKASKNISAEIIVVDNCSTDKSREWLEPLFPQVKFIWNKENEGFSKANNHALKEVSSDYVLFLNPDTILPEDCFEKCFEFFKSHKDCGALGVKLVDGSGEYLKESKRSFPSPLTSFFKLSGIAALFPSSKLFSKYYAGHLSENDSNEIEVLAGAFIMINKTALNSVKGFDEDFFMYGEDIDLSYRIRQAGFKNYYFPGTCIIHFKGESTQRDTKTYINRFYGAMNLFVKKHYSHQKLTAFTMWFAISISRLLAYAKITITNIFSSAKVPNGKPETLLLASQPYFDKLIQLIKYAKPPLVIHGRISVERIDTGFSMGSLLDIEQILVKNKTSKIIFSDELLSYKKIIDLVILLKGKVDFLFHAAGSNSIVGSNSKNSSGVVIAKAEL